MKIGNVLRESRLQSKKSVKEVSDFLTKRGYKASEKTIYSWESGNSKPDIDIFMRLCELYGIKDVLNAFGYREHTEEDELQLSSKETEIIEKYRFITNYSIDGAVTIEIKNAPWHMSCKGKKNILQNWKLSQRNHITRI